MNKQNLQTNNDLEAKDKLADPDWRISHLYKIKTKDKKLATMKPNPAQRDYRKRKSQFDIILKARQLGFSTLKLIEQYDYAITNKNVTCALIAHNKDKVTALFEIIKRAHNNMPEMIKPVVSYDNRNELYFPELDSKIYVALDLRSGTVHNLHLSELAFMEQAEEKMIGILEAVPKDGIISIESTANGMGGYYYETWEDPMSKFKKHFYNWLWDPDYRLKTDKSLEQLQDEYRTLQVKYELIPEIWDRFDIDKEQLSWYIDKARLHKSKVKQEHPTTEEEAFIAKGRNVFSVSDLQKHEILDPIDRKWGNLLIWEQPLKGFAYIIGCDPSGGLGEDNAVIEVINAYTGEQVAEYVDGFTEPDVLGGLLMEIGKYYNNAYIVLEMNNHGIATMNKIKHKYYNIYYREVFDKRSQEIKKNMGWLTTGRTKPILVDDLEEQVRNEDIKIRSRALKNEMKVFVRTEERGRQGFGAEGNAKDDRVIAMGLAVQGIKRLPSMKKPESIAQRKLREYIMKKRGEVPVDELAKKKYNSKIRGIRERKYNSNVN